MKIECSNKCFSKGGDYIIREQDKLLFRTQKERPNCAIVSFHKEYIFSFENINRFFEYDECVKKIEYVNFRICDI